MQLAADAGEASAKTTDIAAAIRPADTSAACSIALPVVCAIVCCLPLGIVAMLFALRSRAALAEGNISQAAGAKRRCELFSWAAFAWAAFMAVLLLTLTTG